MRIAFLMDPIERVSIDKDTTFALMLEAQARGHEVFSLGPSDMFAADGTVYARLTPTRVARVAPPAHATKLPAVLTDLRSVDALFVRTDPPFDSTVPLRHAAPRAAPRARARAQRPEGAPRREREALCDALSRGHPADPRLDA